MSLCHCVATVRLNEIRDSCACLQVLEDLLDDDQDMADM